LPDTLQAFFDSRFVVKIAPHTVADIALQTDVRDGVTLIVDGRVSDTGTLAVDGGTVSGNGFVDSLFNYRGTIEPGASIGALSADTFLQGPGGLLDMELVGGPHRLSDQLFARFAELGGGLRVSILPGAALFAGDTFDLVVAERIVLNEMSIETEGFSARLDLVSLSTSGSSELQALRLTVVPEPAALAWYLVVGALALSCGRPHIQKLRSQARM
jgi:hypothetical protein